MQFDAIRKKALAGERLSREDGHFLLKDVDLLSLGELADATRRRLHPEGIVTYIIDRNINYTNVCTAQCAFCAFYRDLPAKDGYVLSKDEFRQKIEVMHEGIDTESVSPDPAAVFEWNGLSLTAVDDGVTYVARNLEPYRGFHVFMRALPRLLAARPRARIVIVGGDDVSYGRRLPEGQTYRAQYLAELGERIDLSRVHFTGRLPYADCLRLLQVSSAHVYPTYPFVLSWSMPEAMAAGCALVASNTAPVREVVEDGVNGRLVDFFDADELADTVADVLARPAEFAPPLRVRATACARVSTSPRAACHGGSNSSRPARAPLSNPALRG